MAAGGTISIPSVTGNITVTATSVPMDGTYTTSGLTAYWDISEYADGYTGTFPDKVGSVNLITYGLSLSEITQYAPWAGVHDGLLYMGAKYDGGTKEFRYRIPNAAGLGSYPFTYELYGLLHGEIYVYGTTESYNNLVNNFIMFNGRVNDSGSAVNGINLVSVVDDNGTAITFHGSADSPKVTSRYFPNGLPMKMASNPTESRLSHLVVCADRTNRVNKIYFNGELILDGGKSCVTLPGTNALYPQCMHIAKARVYNRILTDTEVKRNYVSCTGNRWEPYDFGS